MTSAEELESIRRELDVLAERRMLLGLSERERDRYAELVELESAALREIDRDV